MKTTLNILGVIIAWILSLVLVVLLTVAPVAFSVLDLLEPEVIFEAVADALDKGEPSAAVPYGVTSLSSVKKQAGSDKPLGDVDLSKIEDIIGDEVDEEIIIKIITSDAATELVKAYTGDVTNAVLGKTEESRFTAEKLVEVVEENIDDITQIVQEVAPDLSKEDIKSLKKEIKTVVRENAEEIVNVVPAPTEVVEELASSGEGGKLVVEILALKNTAKVAIVGAIVLLSVLIFLCRIPDFRGLRWMSTNLFTAGGANAVVCVFLNVGSFAAADIANITELEFVKVSDVISNLLAVFAKGVTVRTIIMLGTAVLLLVVYNLLKLVCRKKAAKQPAPVYAPVQPVYVPVAPVYTPAPVVVTEPVVENCGGIPTPPVPAEGEPQADELY